MQKWVEIFKHHHELEIIDTPLDIELEIPHLAYLEAKKPNGGNALLFTRPISQKHAKTFRFPVLMNIFGSHQRAELIFGKNVQEIARGIHDLLEFRRPKTLIDQIKMLKKMLSLRHVFPKKQHFSKPLWQAKIHRGKEVNLYDLPILTTWKEDAAPFITMGQVYTQSLDGSKKNLGMYRLQVHDRNHLGLHWQIHKDGQHFFHEYKKAGVKMPVSIGLGGDALYSWCGQAPLPCGMYELMLYGYIRESAARVSRGVSNPIYVPSDCDIVIEGWVDVNEMRPEGPFGDHTGFYTPVESYPVLEVSAIAYKSGAIFPATVVGKPPLEDKYMGYWTERIFLPLLQKTMHGLEDIHMPENGVFHNFIIARLDPEYPGHSKQLMHALWGVGQMSFVKHAVFVAREAPDFSNPMALAEYILNRLDVRDLLLTEGICDALDHASPAFAYGGKLGVDATRKEIAHIKQVLEDGVLCQKFQQKIPEVARVVQYCLQSAMPVALIGVQKDQPLDMRAFGEFGAFFGVGILLDECKNDLYNPYMILWRVVNNIDAKRDVCVLKDCVIIDATDKGQADGYFRTWPKEVDCSLEVLIKLRDKGLLKGIDSEFLKRYHIYNSPRSDEVCQI